MNTALLSQIRICFHIEHDYISTTTYSYHVTAGARRFQRRQQAPIEAHDLTRGSRRRRRLVPRERASHQPRISPPRMRTGNGVTPVVAPLGACFLLPLRWECPFPGPIRGGSIPAKISSEREGEREEEDVHPLREFWRETTRPKDNRRRLHSPYKARRTSEACQPPTTPWPRRSVGIEGSTSQHHRPSSLPPSLSPSPSVPQGHHSGGRRRPQRPSPKHLTGLPHGETPLEGGGEAARVGILLPVSSPPPPTPPPPFVLRRSRPRGEAGVSSIAGKIYTALSSSSY